jgi:hypothetical protein
MKQLTIFLISRTDKYDCDNFDSAVVVAESTEQARTVVPESGFQPDLDTWTTPDKVHAQAIAFLPLGSKWKAGDTICSSFNAG